MVAAPQVYVVLCNVQVNQDMGCCCILMIICYLFWFVEFGTWQMEISAVEGWFFLLYMRLKVEGTWRASRVGCLSGSLLMLRWRTRNSVWLTRSSFQVDKIFIWREDLKLIRIVQYSILVGNVIIWWGALLMSMR